MSERETAIIGLKREIKMVRAKARDLREQNERWRDVAKTLRQLAGLNDVQYSRLLSAASLPIE
ncbi:hypothetical protein [Bradyrhizobium diazoefficiens]|uniref:hypothetical protein n=1 Tax=Bradyrhizobium diazoefficiens TaxID=1355477 RepID=UPI000577E713|nr:hypothetical protein [Bradyrhizobium diazoefficiens]